MNRLKLKYIAFLAFWMTTGVVSAQQASSFSQFTYNKQAMNPAYTGYREALNATLIHRSQWIGFEGAPSTQSLTFEMPSKKDEIAYGGAVTFDRIGPTSELNLSGDFAYRIRLRNRNTLSFGAKASLGLMQNNLTDLSLISDYYGETDENFMTNTNGFLMPNAGFGMYYYTADFYIGLSSPRMLRSRLDKKGTLPYQLMEGRLEPTYYFMTGKLWKINRDLSIQPNLLVQATFNAPISFGAHVNMIYMDQLTAGLFYRLGEAVGAIAQWKFNNEWKVGYSLDLAANQLIQTNYGSHEFMINYTLNSKRKRIVYPRYF